VHANRENSGFAEDLGAAGVFGAKLASPKAGVSGGRGKLSSPEELPVERAQRRCANALAIRDPFD
jgi:hypothetical protein